MIEIKKYNNITTEYQLSKKLLESLELSDILEQKNREILFIEDICKRVEKSKTVLYVLKKDNEELGLISVSSSSIEDFQLYKLIFYLLVKNIEV